MSPRSPAPYSALFLTDLLATIALRKRILLTLTPRLGPAVATILLLYRVARNIPIGSLAFLRPSA